MYGDALKNKNTPINNKTQTKQTNTTRSNPDVETTKTDWPEVPEGPITLIQAEAVVLGLSWQEPTKAEINAIAAARARRGREETASTPDDSDDSNPGMESETDEDDNGMAPAGGSVKHGSNKKKEETKRAQESSHNQPNMDMICGPKIEEDPTKKVQSERALKKPPVHL